MGGRLFNGLSLEDCERVIDEARRRTHVHISNLAEVAATEAQSVPDGGWAGSVEGGRISKTGATPSRVRQAIIHALQREEEEEVTVQRLVLTGLYLLAFSALAAKETDSDPA